MFIYVNFYHTNFLSNKKKNISRDLFFYIYSNILNKKTVQNLI